MGVVLGGVMQLMRWVLIHFSESGMGAKTMMLVVKVTKEDVVGGRGGEERKGATVLKKGFFFL